ncbi:hypothetical protein Q5H93_13155 [Hymenobacter sp. ASUV-10]|uniref:Phage protein n=1 Tax=Hymenobacter aranciens TaxID=3063996 RepID=A0ABT9BBN9_9BACT|nr:hypothetical protein [Hymenobacter sp. ASUV-10]MDO7875686.1 hypothetical protein [Hymenobacter sp. ASUV-10]
MADFYPHEIVKQVAFNKNFNTELVPATVLLDLPEKTFAYAQEATGTYLSLHQQLDDARKAHEDLAKRFAQQQSITETAVREVARQVKGIRNVPVDVISLLDIATPTDDAQKKVAAQAPTLKMTVELGVVKGAYTKYKHQGVDVYCCRTGETEFTKLERFSMNRFVDNRPNRVPGQPEQRDYYAVYVDKDQQVGNQSATVSVVVGSRPGA